MKEWKKPIIKDDDAEMHGILSPACSPPGGDQSCTIGVDYGGCQCQGCNW